jgi:hypothetical protein
VGCFAFLINIINFNYAKAKEEKHRCINSKILLPI